MGVQYEICYRKVLRIAWIASKIFVENKNVMLLIVFGMKTGRQHSRNIEKYEKYWNERKLKRFLEVFQLIHDIIIYVIL